MQRAAGATAIANPLPRRDFPWGDDFDTERANLELLIGQASAVGAFCPGSSPVGAEEMAGNVCEWTRSLYGKDLSKPEFRYPYRADDPKHENLRAPDEVRRVVRGGSWFYPRDYARCAYRDWGSPGYRLNGILGCRVVLRSSPVEMPLRRRVLRSP